MKKMKTLMWKDSCTPTFIAALLTIAKIWKHTHTHTHTHTGILFSHKKEWKFANNMDGPGVYYPQWNKSDREK